MALYIIAEAIYLARGGGESIRFLLAPPPPQPTAVNEIYAELYNTQQGLIGKKLIAIMKSGGGEVRHIGSK